MFRGRGRAAVQVCVWLAISALVSSPLDGQVKSAITGSCDYDSATGLTTCSYTVYSGVPALSHLIFPLPENCVELYSVTSDFFRFEPPQLYNDPFCGRIFGIKDEQGMDDGQVATFVVSYEGISKLGIDIIYAGLKGGPSCELFPVPGVVDCEKIPCIEVMLDGTRIHFYNRKPATSAGLLNTIRIIANTPAILGFEAFGDLAPTAGNGSEPIPAFYALAPPDLPDPPAAFLPPSEFNQQMVSVPGDEQEFSISIWMKLAVDQSTAACEYENTAVITITLENSEPYVGEGN